MLAVVAVLVLAAAGAAAALLSSGEDGGPSEAGSSTEEPVKAVAAADSVASEDGPRLSAAGTAGDEKKAVAAEGSEKAAGTAGDDKTAVAAEGSEKKTVAAEGSEKGAGELAEAGERPPPDDSKAEKPPRRSDKVVVDKAEAAKHGVHIGNNVYIGGKKVVVEVEEGEQNAEHDSQSSAAREPQGPKAVAISGINYRSFDVVGYIPTAKRLARRILPDAEFFRLDADGIKPNGMADLTLADGFDVTYRFMSPSAAKRPKDLALGLPFKPNCLIYVTIDRRGSSARLLEGWECKDRPQRIPSCKFKGVWEYARKHLGAPENAVADISYYGVSGGRARYSFSIKGTKASGWVPPDCH